MIYDICLILLLIFVKKASLHDDNETVPNEVPLFGLHFKENSKYIFFSTFVIIICCIKVLYTYAECFSKVIPESNMLLLCGIAVGFGFNWYYKKMNESSEGNMFYITTDKFFNLLLPPIILEASFSMYHRTFASNIVGVLVFAVIATLLNFFFIGLGLTFVNRFDGIQFTTQTVNVSTFWVFSSLIVAVDPVAVLAIFQEIHVDNNLYYLVFGESLLNDGVSVVLYEVMIVLSQFETITATNIWRATLSFILVAIGGSLIGCCISVLTCLLTKFTFKTPLTEPLLVIFFGYMAYLVAGLVKWSGIISMITYGVFQATYGFQNITQKSLILIKRLSKILSNISEAIIFISLGVSATTSQIDLMSSFTCWSLFLCLYGRFVFTLFLSAIINYFEFNIRKIAWNEQFIIAYGGLRGAIAYCLSFLIDKNIPINTDDIQQTTIVIILFTIFFMGLTMKPLVKMLNIEIAKPDEISLFVQITESTIDHVLAGIEEIIGMKGRNSIHEFLANIDELYIRPFLQRDPLGREEKIMKVYEKLNLTMHMATTAPTGTPMSAYYLNKLKPHLRHWTLENYARPDTMSLHYSTNMRSVITTNDTSEKSKLDSKELLSFNKLFCHRRSSEINMDHSRFAHRMTAMLYRKRRSLAATAPKPQKLKPKSSRQLNESEIEIFTFDSKRKRD